MQYINIKTLESKTFEGADEYVSIPVSPDWEFVTKEWKWTVPMEINSGLFRGPRTIQRVCRIKLKIAYNVVTGSWIFDRYHQSYSMPGSTFRVTYHDLNPSDIPENVSDDIDFYLQECMFVKDLSKSDRRSLRVKMMSEIDSIESVNTHKRNFTVDTFIKNS